MTELNIKVQLQTEKSNNGNLQKHHRIMENLSIDVQNVCAVLKKIIAKFL